jgi:type I restriction enzyme, S subunit
VKTPLAPLVQVGDCANIVNGFAFKSELFTTERKGMPVVRIRDVVRGRTETYYTGEYSDSAVVRNGDLLVGMDGEFNIARWQGGAALLNQRVCKLEAKAGVSDISYLHHALAIVLKRVENRTPFATVKHLSSKELKEQTVPLPDLPEQLRIAQELEQAARLRRTYRYALELTDTFLPGTFLELFGCLHENEQKWSIERLEENAEIVSGVAKGQKYRDSKTVEVPYLRVANVQDGYLDLSEIKTIRVPPEYLEALRLRPGDVVMTEGGDFDKLGRGAIWPGGIRDCIHQNHIFRVRLNQSALVPRFFAAFLRSGFAKSYFLRCSKQTTNLASINMTQLRATPTPLPPLPLQQKFASLVERVDHLRAVRREALRQAEHLFASLLDRAFASERAPSPNPST